METYFPSWETIEKHGEVVKFVCGLMPDPRPLVDHVYTMLNEYILGEMRNYPLLWSYIDTSLLESLYQESAVPLPSSALHNQHINYYKHYDTDVEDEYDTDDEDEYDTDDEDEYDTDDEDKYDTYDDDELRDMTSVFTPCKLYVFKNMWENVTFEDITTEMGVTRCTGPAQSQPNSFNNQECAIIIHRPYESLIKRLLSLCRTISASQPVTHFYFNSLYRYKLTEANMPEMSKEAKSLTFECVDVSSRVWNYFLQHESIQLLRLKDTGLHDGAVPLIFNHRNLKVLSLNGAKISHEMCQYVCHHLPDLVHLEEIDLSCNDLSGISSIRLSNITSPVTLKLAYTHMTPELFKSICQLTSAVKLKELELRGNTLTGHLHRLLSEPHQGLQSLEELYLNRSELNKNDIEVLTRAMQRQVLPGLNVLVLNDNKLDTVQRETEKMIQTCVTHHQKELDLWLQENYLPEEIKEKWNRVCQKTDIKLHF